MHTKLRAAALLAAVGSAAACESVVAPEVTREAMITAAQSHAGGSTMVPITIRETYAPAPDAIMVACDPAAAGVALPSTILATGRGTHLGRIHSVLTGTGCSVDVGTGLISATGTVVHTAANGDELHAAFEATLGAGVLMLGTITFTGGTGRFENASGDGAGGGTFDAATGGGWFEVKGAITRPNSGD